MERSAGIIIEKDDLFLLLRYRGDYWGFAKGRIEPGETEEQAAIREVKEETGLDVAIIPGFKHTIEWIFTKDGKITTKTASYFVCHARSDNVVISKEHQDFIWLSYDKAIKRIKFDKDRSVLMKAREFLDNEKL